MIYLTRGQIRRRWIISLLTLLTALPSPIVFMGLLFKGGKLSIRSGKLLMGTCADCCPGGGGGGDCSDCASSHSCSICDAGVTPTQWTVSIASVTNAFPCTLCTSVGGNVGEDIYFQDGTGTLNGTYTVPQLVSFPCIFSLPATGPEILASLTAGCSSPTSRTQATLQIKRAGAGISLNVTGLFSAGGFTSSLAHWFFGSATGTNCCNSYNLTNDFTSYSCDGGDQYPVLGINGTAVVTPC